MDSIVIAVWNLKNVSGTSLLFFYILVFKLIVLVLEIYKKYSLSIYLQIDISAILPIP